MLRVIILLIRRAEEKLDEVEHWPTTEGIQIFTSLVPQVRVPLVIEHFVGSQIHAGVQDLYQKEIGNGIYA